MLLPLLQNNQQLGGDKITAPRIESTLVLGSHSLERPIEAPRIESTLVLGAHALVTSINVPRIESTLAMGTPTLYGIAPVALLKSDLSESHRATMAEYRRHGYINNGWDKQIRWNGFDQVIHLAGIKGPSTGQDSWVPVPNFQPVNPPTSEPANTTPGLHVFRFRYQDSTTGYVSNPSEEREIIIPDGLCPIFPVGPGIPPLGPYGIDFVVAANVTQLSRLDAGNWATDGIQAGDLVVIENATNPANNQQGHVDYVDALTIGLEGVAFVNDDNDLTATIRTDSNSRIPLSSDPKVDTIVLEATTVDDAAAAWFLAASYKQADAGTSIWGLVFNLPDNELEVNFLPWPDVGHDPPPVAKVIVSHRDRIWLFGQVTHTTGNVTLQGGSANVLPGSIPTDWRASVLGDKDPVPQVDFKTVTWHLAVAGVSGTHEVDHYSAANGWLVLKDPWSGPNLADVNYQLFSRANVIWVSEAGFPESYSPLKFLNGPNGEGAGDLTAGVGYGTSMLFYSPNSMFKLAWDRGPLLDPQQWPLSNKYGALNQRVVIEVEGTVYSFDRRGWTQWRGVAPSLISRPLEKIRRRISWSAHESFHAAWYPELRAIRWFIALDGLDAPKDYVQWDVDTQTWSTGRFYQTMTDSRVVPTDDGLRTIMGDENGHTWVADEDTADGVSGRSSHHLALGTSTDTVIDLVPDDLPLPVALSGSQGCFAYFPALQEGRLIVANTGVQLTLESALSSAPLLDDPVWVGPIPTKLRTKAFASRDISKKHKNRYLWLEFSPLAKQRKLQMRIYQDLDASPRGWADYSDPDRSRTPINSLEFPETNPLYPGTDWIIDMAEQDGSIMIPIGSEYYRYTEFEFEILEPDAPIEIISFQIDADGALESEQ